MAYVDALQVTEESGKILSIASQKFHSRCLLHICVTYAMTLSREKCQDQFLMFTVVI